MRNLVIDSGPLIALFNAKDKYHKKAVEFIRANKYELFTTISAITEVVYVLDFNVNAQTDFLLWISRGGVKIKELEEKDLERCAELMRKYSTLPMDFADATIICACEKIETKFIATIDSDFEIYRYKNKQKFKNLFLYK